MKRLIFIILLSLSICLGSCSSADDLSANNSVFRSTVSGSSYFTITFFNVGHGDAALVECDKHYMLIDGGDKESGDKLYDAMVDKEIQHLDILAISHLHEDHIGGLPKALTYASKIDLVISNSKDGDKDAFEELNSTLIINKASITIPHVGDKYMLGSAEVEVVDVSSDDVNDSLVLLITYGNTRFLFTGDIGEKAQRRIQSKYDDGSNKPFKIDLMKMPHHGSDVLIRFVDVFMPDYAIISAGNRYGLPKDNTLKLLDQARARVYRTDINGDIIVKSDGKTVSIQ